MLQPTSLHQPMSYLRCVCLRFKLGRFSSQIRRFSSVGSYYEELKTRGLVRNSYPSNLDTDFASELKRLPPVVYAGFDPTAKSLHIGNLLVIVNLLRSAQFGIRPIAVVGGATATIGDPSGRSSGW
ncbi:hypothetical protein OESDEN_16761 [Oesophagostomum dentatum]|uniref:Tyrosine--tRNA ligase n=1 Tax=Oesophagostomum dentatum TaxID=61180 RepID=A0A0B1SJZ0_OESDE|nr:hypothetical protein OESDEN_16761 [Oesophagostomum dentatum]